MDHYSKRALSPCHQSSEEGAQTTIYLAVSEEVEGVTGKYFSDCRVSDTAWPKGRQ